MSIQTATVKRNVAKNGKKASGSLYQKKNGVGKQVAYMEVPAAFAMLPSDATVIQKKRLDVKDVKGGKGFEIYILACSPKRSYNGYNGQVRYVQNWYVAKKHYFGGKPAFDEMLYKGTSKRDAAHRFASIPYNQLDVKVPEGVKIDRAAQTKKTTYKSSTGKTYESNWAVFRSNGEYKAIAANRSRRYLLRQNSNGARLNRR